MRASILLVVGICSLVMGVGCSSSPEIYGPGPTAVGETSSPTRSRWSPYLNVMSDGERVEFLDIEDSFERDQWIRREGIDVRAELNRSLSRGISVEAAKRRIIEPIDEQTKNGDTTMLFYSRFNTESRTNFWLMFRSDQLVSWNAYPLAELEREEDLLEFENRLMLKFNTVLERGMGMQEIRMQAENARENLNRVELAHREKLADPGFKRNSEFRVSMDDYLVAEALLYAQNRDDLFAWFQGREPDHIVVHRPFETHRYFLVYTDIWGNDTEVVVEFIYENSQLVDWFVYHEE